MMRYDIGEMAEKGMLAEEIVIAWLKNSSQIATVIKATNEKLMQAIDIDVCVRLEDGRNTLIEIKSDAHLVENKNVLFEIQRIYTNTKNLKYCSVLGWSTRTHAEYIAWYAPSIKKIMLVKTDHYRFAFQQYIKAVGKKPRFDTVITEKDECSTVNVIFPIKWLNGNYRFFDLDEPFKIEEITDLLMGF